MNNVRSILVGILFSGIIFAVHDLTIVGPLIMEDGLGGIGIGFIDVLKNELSINCISTVVGRQTDVPLQVSEIIHNQDQIPGKVAICFGMLWDKYGSKVEKLPASYLKLAYSMLESTAIPKEWVDILNNTFDAVLVPDEWLVEIYKQCGVQIPIFVFPHGIYLDEFLKRPAHMCARKPFTFGMSAGFWPRKNHELLIDAFTEEFGNTPDVRLRIHGRNILSTLHPGHDVEKQIRKLVEEKGDILKKFPHLVKKIKHKIVTLKDKCIAAVKKKLDMFEKPSEYINTIVNLKNKVLGLKAPNIEFIDETLTVAEYVEFIDSLDVYVGLSRGEGFGVPPRQALAAGIPCILTNNTAHRTICATGFVCSLETPLVVPAYYDVFNSYCGYQFTCSKDAVRSVLRHVYTNYAQYLAKAHQAREWVRQYNYAQLKEKYVTLIKPKQVILGSANTIEPGKIVTTSLALFEKYQHLMRYYQS